MLIIFFKIKYSAFLLGNSDNKSKQQPEQQQWYQNNKINKTNNTILIFHKKWYI